MDNTNPSLKPVRVAVIGAGIAGLATAVALARLVPEDALKIDVYEQAQEIKEIGHGIAFWTRTWPIFEQLGIVHELEKQLGRKIDVNENALLWKVMKCDREKSADIFEFYKAGQFLQFHRATVQKILLDALPPSVQVHLSHRLTSYTETDDSVSMNFDGRPPIECDLLVAADGIKSRIRAQFISKRIPDQQASIDPVWDGIAVYRSLVDAEKVKKIYPDHLALSKVLLYTGRGKYGVSYPILQGRYIAVSAMVHSKDQNKLPTSADAEKDFVLSLYSGWSEDFLVLLKSGDNYNQWAIQYLNPLPSFGVGRVLLAGDAAHAMVPTQGSGAGQAIEDAYILAHLLRKSTQDNIPIYRVTEAYTKARVPLANLVLQRSSDLCRLYMYEKEGYEGTNNAGMGEEEVRGLFEKFRSDAERIFDWWEMYPVEGGVKEALGYLVQ